MLVTRPSPQLSEHTGHGEGTGRRVNTVHKQRQGRIPTGVQQGCDLTHDERIQVVVADEVEDVAGGCGCSGACQGAQSPRIRTLN